MKNNFAKPLKTCFLRLIRFYQVALSPDQGVVRVLFSRPTCRFFPSCSEYTYQAVEKYGVVKGVWLGLKRIGRCHPFSSGGHDPLV